MSSRVKRRGPSGVAGVRAQRAPAARARSQRGASAAEAAAVVPLLVSVVMGLVWMLGLATTQVRVVDGAQEAARVAARGDDTATAREAGRRFLPEGARVTLRYEGDRVIARVEARVQTPGGVLDFLPSPVLSAESLASREEP